MRRSRENRKPLTWLVASVWLLATAVPVTASGGDQWEYDARIYLWAPSIDATTQSGDSIDVSFSDILDDLDMAFMGTLGARKGKWSLALDGIYMDVSQDDAGSRTMSVLGTTRKFNVDVDIKTLITTFGGNTLLVFWFFR